VKSIISDTRAIINRSRAIISDDAPTDTSAIGLGTRRRYGAKRKRKRAHTNTGNFKLSHVKRQLKASKADWQRSPGRPAKSSHNQDSRRRGTYIGSGDCCPYSGNE